MTAIAVFGLGYVGAVSAACLADRGNAVIGVDVAEEKVAQINAGRTPVLEEGVEELVSRTVGSGALRATSDHAQAVRETDVALVCVGTPSTPHGGLDTSHLQSVAEQIGACLRLRGGRRYTIVFRSTMLPTTTEEVLIPILERESCLTAGTDFGVAVNPEFLREGSSIADFYDPPKTVIGQLDAASGDVVASLYQDLPGPVHRVPCVTAEMAKYVDNAFHATKITFANEIGAICGELGIDSHQVMDVFASDTKLNISRAYLRPGFAFGGSCLPKDLRALTHAARHRDVRVPFLDSILPANDEQIHRVFRLVSEHDATRVGLFGISFKAGTDDLRESPMVELAERLYGRGFNLAIHDGQVALSSIHGANRIYVERRIPHLADLMVATPAEVVAHAEVIVMANGDQRYVDAVARAPEEVVVIDLVRTEATRRLALRERYSGVSW